MASRVSPGEVCQLLDEARSCVLLVGDGPAAHPDPAGVGQLAAHLAATQRLVRVYVSGAQPAAAVAAGASSDDADSVDALTVRVAATGNDDESAARDAALADAHSPIDVLLVLRAADAAAGEWAAVAELLSEAATCTVVVAGASETAVHSCCAALAGDVVVVPTDEHELVRMYMGHVSAAVAAAAAGHDESTGCDTDGSPRRPQRGARSKPRGRGRDKPNLNHLLNFSLPVRLPPPTPVRPRRHAAGAVDERAAAASRAAFINANFRFVLKPVHWPALMAVARRPDMALRAEWIERVVVPTAAAAANCPICLSSPAAARITKCGHLYCLPCILRHLSYGDSADESPKKCPVCWCSISADSLLPVHMWTTHYDAACPRLPPRRGPGAAAAARNVVRMRLMRRRRGSTVCLPRASVPPACAADPVDAAHFPWTFTDDALPFAKALLAAEDYCADEYRREIRELQRVRDDEEPDSEPRLFTEAALMTVEAALDAARTPAADWRRLEEQARAAQLAPPRNSATSEETRAEPPGSSGASGHAADEEETDSDSDDVYYIYQADDGQHIYMHPLHMRILAHDRGGYAALPDSIEIKPRYAVESVITDEVRRRFRFLDHLPLRCEITVVEPELRGVVARASSDKFRTQLAHHDRQHAARARSAAADEARAEMVAAAAAAAATAAAIQAAEACGSPAYCALPAASLAADRPDISGFPALGEPASPASGNSSRAADRRNGPAWPRQPSGAPGGGGTVHGDIWARFERAADSANGGGSGYGSDHDADRGDDPEDCSIPVKNPTAPAVAPQGSDKKKRGANKGPKLMLSGASTRRSR